MPSIFATKNQQSDLEKAASGARELKLQNMNFRTHKNKTKSQR